MALFVAIVDIIVTFHSLYVAFTVGGELAILLGGLLRWDWVRKRAFRMVHLASVLLVALEASVGVLCAAPPHLREYRLRELAGLQVEPQISFVARLVRMIIYYDFPSRVFLCACVGFAAVMDLTFILLPPRRANRKGW